MTTSDRDGGFATRAIHAGEAPDPTTRAHNTPIYMTATFTFDTGEEKEAAVDGARLRDELGVGLVEDHEHIAGHPREERVERLLGLAREEVRFERERRRFSTPVASRVPRTMWYRTPGRSFTRPPRIITTECS